MKHKIIIAVIISFCFIALLNLKVNGQVQPAISTEKLRSCINYSVLSQRPLNQEEFKLFGKRGLNIAVKMRLSNECNSQVYYLTGYTIIGTGYRFFRKKGETEWQYSPPTRGRGGEPAAEFTGVAYTWLELPANSAVEYEIRDWNNLEEEHAFSVFIKENLEYKSIEIVSNVFQSSKMK